jgi:alpha-glucosidase
MDFRNSDEMIFDYWDHEVTTSVIVAASPKRLLTKTSEYTGRMRALPDWVHRGAILGIQGGSEKVRQVLKSFEPLRPPIAGVWLQDWVGQRRTAIGHQLWWNWELNKEHYPGWLELKNDLASRDIRILGYINPFLVELPNDVRHVRHLYEEARGKGFLLRDAQDKVMKFKITSFDAALLDLSNPDAKAWIQSVVQSEMIDQGFSGWMADFGEALPIDVKIFSGDANSYHNHYPEVWAEVNRKLIDRQKNPDDFVFFTRSGFSQSPRYSTLFWTGDQLVTWDEYDGLKSAVTAILSSGLSGMAFNHSDVGGYTAISLPGLSYRRSEELLMRWMEFSAFTCVFRTHEGSQPENNVQVYSNESIRQSFARNAAIFQSLFNYRKRLIREATEEGWPVVRTMWLEFPGESSVWTNQRQFMLGDEILVAPVLEPGQTAVRVFLPKGRWVHLLTSKEFNIEESHWIAVDAPLGQPAAFRRVP